MKWILTKALLLIMASTTHNAQDNCYSAWTDTGIHLIMSDNGTPNNFDDDWVVDWETNREFKVTILDN